MTQNSTETSAVTAKSAGLLRNKVRDYAWGSTTVMAEFLGQEPTGEPQAEMWIGTHESAPSQIIGLTGEESLLDRIIADPVGEIGPELLAESGPRLPFLLKVIAIAAPLSLQAHPTTEQAIAGFAAEEAAGIPIDAPYRNYRDSSAKPEMICALTPLRALCGFRKVADTIDFLQVLAVDSLKSYVDILVANPSDGLREIVRDAFTRPAEQRNDVVTAIAQSCQDKQNHPTFSAEFAVIADLAERYPGDPGVLVALLMNLVELAPGEAFFMGAGNAHVYLHGLGVEIMANSDNVLRGGFTPKHIDVPELLKVLDFTNGPIEILTGQLDAASSDDTVCEEIYNAPVRDFRLSRLTINGGRLRLDNGYPQIVLAVEGNAELIDDSGQPLPLTKGESAYVPATAAITVTGTAVLFRATSNLPASN